MNAIKTQNYECRDTISINQKLFYYSYGLILNIKNYLFWLDINDRIKRYTIT
jgi:hypothetical protein